MGGGGAEIDSAAAMLPLPIFSSMQRLPSACVFVGVCCFVDIPDEDKLSALLIGYANTRLTTRIRLNFYSEGTSTCFLVALSGMCLCVSVCV